MPEVESRSQAAGEQRFTWEAASWVTGVSLEQLRRVYQALLPGTTLPKALTMEEIHWLAGAVQSDFVYPA